MFSTQFKRAASKGVQKFAQGPSNKNLLVQNQFKMFNSSSAGFRRSTSMQKPQSQSDNFANGTSAVYVDQMYDMWVEDPKSVHASWAAYFNNVEGGVEEPYQQPPSLGQDSTSGAIPNLE